MEKQPRVTLRKIPVQILIETLQEIWETGADFVDVVGIPDDTQDEIGLVVREEYYTSEPDAVDDEEDFNDLT